MSKFGPRRLLLLTLNAGRTVKAFDDAKIASRVTKERYMVAVIIALGGEVSTESKLWKDCIVH